MSERYCTVTFDWVTDYTVIQVHINSQGETEEEAIQHAADMLKASWGKQIAINVADLLDVDNIRADMRRNSPEVTWGEEVE
jgi:hypothetical protein